MTKRKEWIKIEETGQLYIEKVLVNFDVPIFFICKNAEDKKYLCLEIDYQIGQYVIAETTNNELIKMLQNKVYMEQLFRNCVNGKIIVTKYDFKEKSFQTLDKDAQNISQEFLPKEETYFDMQSETISEYIDILTEQISNASREKNKISTENFKINEVTKVLYKMNSNMKYAS